MDNQLIGMGLSSFAGALILMRILAPAARRLGLVDHPGGRKGHDAPTPLIGGIAMAITFASALLLMGDTYPTPWLLFAGALLLLTIGAIDDLREISTWARFGAQVSAALIMTLGAGVILGDLGCLTSVDQPIVLGILGVPLTAFATVGVINAVNMSDGIDGLAGSLALVAVAALSLMCWAAGQWESLSVLTAMAGVLLAFLLLNLRPRGRALVFMGDAGSMFLGFVLAWLLVKFSQGPERAFAPVVALWVFALPLLDTVSMMLRRILLGRSPFLADREHFHHVLLAAGFTPKQTLGVMVLFASTAAAIGLAGHFISVPEHWMFAGFILLFTLYFWLIMSSWRQKRFLNRPLLQSAESQV
jgi:UDP-GlcNAc:undecaprenyl-phosphate GlcNAc-1-phosphate transferase